MSASIYTKKEKLFNEKEDNRFANVERPLPRELPVKLRNERVAALQITGFRQVQAIEPSTLLALRGR